jgi:hypothetical protein
MKFLKKASLAASIAAVSFAANAELVAMDEMAMAAATGQAGIDLDIELSGTDAISIGSIVYTDTDTDGSLTIDTISVGAADGGVLTLTNAIDITADGDLQIVGGAVNGLLVSVGSVDLSGGANLVSDLSLNINMGESTTVISQAAAGDADGVAENATKIDHTGSFQITDGSVDLLDGGIQISGIEVYNMVDDGTGTMVKGAVTTDLVMWTDADALNIKAGFEGSIELGSVTLGSSATAASIGSVAINDLAMTGATIKVSGH